jgi:CheY-like chemotaxis protein
MAALTEHLRDIPIVAMSGDREHLIQAAAAGAASTLEKPLTLNRLLALVQPYYSTSGWSSRAQGGLVSGPAIMPLTRS